MERLLYPNQVKKFIFVKDLLVNFWWIHWHQDKMVQLVQPKYGFDLDPILSSQSWFQIIWACVVPFVLWYQKLSMPWFPCKCKVLIHCWVPLTCSCQFPKSSWKLSNLFPKLKLIFHIKGASIVKAIYLWTNLSKAWQKAWWTFWCFVLPQLAVFKVTSVVAILSLFISWKTCFCVLLFSGFYSFSIFYTTRLCGALSLCGPTVLRFYKNEQILRTFSRDLATDAKADQDMVNSLDVLF